MGIRFPVAKLLDWAGSEAKLEDSSNPFAVVTSAHLATRSTRHDPHARYQAKLRLVRSLYRRGWDRQRVVDLFRVLDWMMRLPDELETKFQQDLEFMEEGTAMRFVSSLEKLAIKKGMEQGMQQGMQQGRVEGSLYILRQLLERRFGQLPAWAESRLTTATQADIEAWTATFIGANSIEEVLGAVPASDKRSVN